MTISQMSTLKAEYSTDNPVNRVRAWYVYAFAAEVFAACAMAIFLPITLEQMAREIGYISPDLVLPCSGVSGDEPGQAVCKAKILGSWVDTASFSMYVKSIAVATQALFIITVGPLADSAFWRKRLLLAFAYMGSVSSMALLFFPSSPHGWVPVLTAGLTIIGNVGYATSIVCANAFLPGLAREDPAVLKGVPGFTRQGERGGDEDEEEGRALLSNLAESVLSSERLVVDDRERLGHLTNNGANSKTILSLAMSRISATGTAIGFGSGVTVLGLLLIPVVIGEGSTTSLCLAIGLSGLWWSVFTVPAWFGLPSGSRHLEKAGATPSLFGSLGTGWSRVGGMIHPQEIQKLPNLFTFLLAWIFLSDGFHTTTYTAILYASSSLHMPPFKVIFIGILVQLAAVFSSILAPRYQKHLGWTNLKVLLHIVLLAEVIPFYACLGLILPFGGLRTEWEMYIAATFFGMLYGPFNSYSRAVYAELIPHGHESSFFSLFALTDKSASLFGPLGVGLIADSTGNIRLGFLFLLIMLLLPIPVLLRVDVSKGASEGTTWAMERRLIEDQRRTGEA